MKYSYRDEYIISTRSDIGGFVFLGIWILFTLAVFLADAYIILFKNPEGIGTPVLEIMFGIVVIAIAWTLYRGIHKRRKKAFERRKKAMRAGTRYRGKIVKAGKEMEYEKQSEWDHEKGETKTWYTKAPNYWIEVEYYYPVTGEVKRHHAKHMIKNMECFIGRDVDIYVWQEMDPYLNEMYISAYIDTRDLG